MILKRCYLNYLAHASYVIDDEETGIAAVLDLQRDIDGSLYLPLNTLAERLSEIPAGRAVILHDAGGHRSSIAASRLQGGGFTDVSQLAGGLAAWETAGFPVIST